MIFKTQETPIMMWKIKTKYFWSYRVLSQAWQHARVAGFYIPQRTQSKQRLCFICFDEWEITSFKWESATQKVLWSPVHQDYECIFNYLVVFQQTPAYRHQHWPSLVAARSSRIGSGGIPGSDYKLQFRWLKLQVSRHKDWFLFFLAASFDILTQGRDKS